MAWRHLPKIVLWTLLSAGVGFVLQVLAERLKLAGRLATWAIGMAWALATVFVLPVLLYEDRSVPGAVKRSASLFRQRWGEDVAGNGALAGAVALVLVPLLLVLTTVAVLATGAVWPAFVVTVGVITVATGALTGVFNAALYRFAVSGEALGPFTADDLGDAYRPKRRRWFR